MSAYPYRYRSRGGRGPLIAAAGVAVLLATHPGVKSSGHGTAAASTAGYVNPLAGQAWTPARTDQGVDYHPVVPEPVRAIGAGVVVFSSTTDCGWPGCAFLGYKLTAGPKAGNVVYVAEHLTGLAPQGTTFGAGARLAIAWPGYPWTEWGWADCAGDAPAVRYGGNADGTAMAGGLAFARFMRELGAGTAQDPGPGPDTVGSC